MGYNKAMARVDCNCGWSCQVPDPVRRALFCPVCRATVQPRARVPYGYRPFSSWHGPARISPPLPVAQANTPARVSLICGGLALFMALFTATDRMDKGVVSLSLLALATAIIGLHLSGSDAVRKRGRVSGFFGLTFAIIALLTTPLPSGPQPCTLKRRDYAPATKILIEPAPVEPLAPRAPSPAPKPAQPEKPADAEQEEGF